MPDVLYGILPALFVAWLGRIAMEQAPSTIWVRADGERVIWPSSEQASKHALKIGLGAGLIGVLIKIGDSSYEQTEAGFRLAVLAWIGAGIGYARMDRQKEGDGLVKVKKEDLLNF